MQIRFSSQHFGAWLREISAEAGITSGPQLYRAMVRACDDLGSISEKTVERWFTGQNAPRDVDPILRTLSASIPETDVLDRFETFLTQEWERYRSFHLRPAHSGAESPPDSGTSNLYSFYDPSDQVFRALAAV